VVGVFTSGDHPIMARLTVYGYPFMGEVVDIPGTGCVAGVTLTIGLQVISVFTAGTYTIMTGGTDACCFDRTMIKADITPVAGRVMAEIALFSGLDVGGVHTGCLTAIVTTGTTAGRIDTTVIKTGIQPVVSGEMTDVALFTGLNMLGVLAGCPCTVMAGGTDSGTLETVMTEVNHMPVCRSCMTDVAGFIGDDVIIVFTWCLHPVVTGCTGARHNFAVIKTDHTPILCRGMAGIALCRCLYMICILTRLGNSIMTTGAAAKNLFSMDKVDH
jgi:hypothetical protein